MNRGHENDNHGNFVLRSSHGLPFQWIPLLEAYRCAYLHAHIAWMAPATYLPQQAVNAIVSPSPSSITTIPPSKKDQQEEKCESTSQEPWDIVIVDAEAGPLVDPAICLHSTATFLIRGQGEIGGDLRSGDRNLSANSRLESCLRSKFRVD